MKMTQLRSRTSLFLDKVEFAETIAKVLGGDSTDTKQAIRDEGSEDEKNRKSSK